MYGDASSPASPYGSQAAEAWAANYTGSRSVYVGVLDEGVQWTHPDLDANVWTNPRDPADGIDNDRNGYRDDVHGWDFSRNDNSVYDGGSGGNQDDHGTHIAGILGAEGNNGTGVVGVNWQVTIIPLKFLGPLGGSTANAVKAINYLIDLKTRHKLNIVAINASWGGSGYSSALNDAIKRAGDNGILFIAAAGNNGRNNDTTPFYPASYNQPNVISVAALDRNGNLASWSNYGRNTVHLAAPGVGIYSTLAFNTYGSYSGTSMATPHVTGAVALYKSKYPSATAAQIKAALLTSVAPTASLSGKTITGGRLDISKLLQLHPWQFPATFDSNASRTTGGSGRPVNGRRMLEDVREPVELLRGVASVANPPATVPLAPSQPISKVVTAVPQAAHLSESSAVPILQRVLAGVGGEGKDDTERGTWFLPTDALPVYHTEPQAPTTKQTEPAAIPIELPASWQQACAHVFSEEARTAPAESEAVEVVLPGVEPDQAADSLAGIAGVALLMGSYWASTPADSEKRRRPSPMS
jgi:hypothetical protein